MLVRIIGKEGVFFFNVVLFISKNANNMRWFVMGDGFENPFIHIVSEHPLRLVLKCST